MSRYTGYTEARRRANKVYYRKHRTRLLFREKVRRWARRHGMELPK